MPPKKGKGGPGTLVEMDVIAETDFEKGANPLYEPGGAAADHDDGYLHQVSPGGDGGYLAMSPLVEESELEELKAFLQKLSKIEKKTGDLSGEDRFQKAILAKLLEKLERERVGNEDLFQLVFPLYDNSAGATRASDLDENDPTQIIVKNIFEQDFNQARYGKLLDRFSKNLAAREILKKRLSLENAAPLKKALATALRGDGQDFPTFSYPADSESIDKFFDAVFKKINEKQNIAEEPARRGSAKKKSGDGYLSVVAEGESAEPSAGETFDKLLQAIVAGKETKEIKVLLRQYGTALARSAENHYDAASSLATQPPAAQPARRRSFLGTLTRTAGKVVGGLASFFGRGPSGEGSADRGYLMEPLSEGDEKDAGDAGDEKGYLGVGVGPEGVIVETDLNGGELAPGRYSGVAGSKDLPLRPVSTDEETAAILSELFSNYNGSDENKKSNAKLILLEISKLQNEKRRAPGAKDLKKALRNPILSASGDAISSALNLEMLISAVNEVRSPYETVGSGLFLDDGLYATASDLARGAAVVGPASASSSAGYEYVATVATAKVTTASAMVESNYDKLLRRLREVGGEASAAEGFAVPAAASATYAVPAPAVVIAASNPYEQPVINNLLFEPVKQALQAAKNKKEDIRKILAEAFAQTLVSDNFGSDEQKFVEYLQGVLNKFEEIVAPDEYLTVNPDEEGVTAATADDKKAVVTPADVGYHLGDGADHNPYAEVSSVIKKAFEKGKEGGVEAERSESERLEQKKRWLKEILKEAVPALGDADAGYSYLEEPELEGLMDGYLATLADEELASASTADAGAISAKASASAAAAEKLLTAIAQKANLDVAAITKAVVEKLDPTYSFAKDDLAVDDPVELGEFTLDFISKLDIKMTQTILLKLQGLGVGTYDTGADSKASLRQALKDARMKVADKEDGFAKDASYFRGADICDGEVITYALINIEVEGAKKCCEQYLESLKSRVPGAAGSSDLEGDELSGSEGDFEVRDLGAELEDREGYLEILPNWDTKFIITQLRESDKYGIVAALRVKLAGFKTYDTATASPPDNTELHDAESKEILAKLITAQVEIAKSEDGELLRKEGYFSIPVVELSDETSLSAKESKQLVDNIVLALLNNGVVGAEDYANRALAALVLNAEKSAAPATPLVNHSKGSASSQPIYDNAAPGSTAPAPSSSTVSAPSDAPAPSAATSAAPSTAPTPSAATSSAPSVAPTPSAATSTAPSVAPTPSAATSTAPSVAPTPSAATSAAPSTAPTPSAATSSAPSVAPTPSAATSATPSTAPTPSAAPSVTPTPSVPAPRPPRLFSAAPSATVSVAASVAPSAAVPSTLSAAMAARNSAKYKAVNAIPATVGANKFKELNDNQVSRLCAQLVIINDNSKGDFRRVNDSQFRDYLPKNRSDDQSFAVEFCRLTNLPQSGRLVRENAFSNKGEIDVRGLGPDYLRNALKQAFENTCTQNVVTGARGSKVSGATAAKSRP